MGGPSVRVGLAPAIFTVRSEDLDGEPTEGQRSDEILFGIIGDVNALAMLATESFDQFEVWRGAWLPMRATVEIGINDTVDAGLEMEGGDFGSLSGEVAVG